GLITDIFGFTLLSPPGRAVVRTRLKRWFERLMASQATQGRVIVVDSRRIDEPDDDVSDNDVS
ncbi:MAG: FxsA family protein, partial [Acidobacteriota bacterium]